MSQKANVKNRMKIIESSAMIGIEGLVSTVFTQFIETFITSRIVVDLKCEIRRWNRQLMIAKCKCLGRCESFDEDQKRQPPFGTYRFYRYHIQLKCFTSQQPIE